MRFTVCATRHGTRAPRGVANRVQAVRDFVVDRRATLLAVLEPEPPPWTQPLREPFCLAEVGTVTATFPSAWASLGQNPLAAGSGAMTIDAYGNTVEPTTVARSPARPRAGPGRDPDDGRAGLRDVLMVMAEPRHGAPAKSGCLRSADNPG